MSYTWSEECTQALREYIDAGVTFVRTAQLLNERFGTNYNRSSVCKKLIRLRTPKQGRKDSSVFWPVAMKERLRELYSTAPPVSFTDIADLLNKQFDAKYSRESVIGQARRLGLSGKKPASSANKTPRIRIVAPNKNSNQKRLVQPAPNKEMIALRCVEITPLKVSLIDLEPGQCRYPYGGDDGEPITFCGHGKQDGSSYCTPHYHLTRKVEVMPSRKIGVAA